MQLTLGEMLYRFRIERDVEAQQVCHGICSSSTMSKMESGQSIPDILMFECLVERIGVSTELFSIMVTEDESIYLKWRNQVWDAIEDEKWDTLGELLQSKVIKKTYCNKKLETQFFSYASAIYHAKKGNYTKAVILLKTAAEQTIPELSGIIAANILLSTLELSVLMLYLYYGIKGGILTEQQGKHFFDLLDNYMDSNALGLNEASMCYPKLVCIGVQVLKRLTKKKIRSCLEKAVRLSKENKSFFDIVEVLRLYIPFLEKSHSKELGVYRKQYEVFCDLLESENISIEFKPEIVKVRKPKYYIISEYLLSKRNELGITQSKLSEGICEPETYSRVENGKRAPSRKNMEQLSDRLGISWNYYRGEINTTDPKAYQLIRQQRIANIEGRRKESLDILKELETLLDMELLENYQYVKSNEYVLKYKLGSLNKEDTYSKLNDLINLTSGIHRENDQLVYYTQTELETIGYMVWLLGMQKRYKDGIQLIIPILKQMQYSKLDLEYQWNGFDFLFRLLAALYCSIEQYENAIEIARYVKNVRIRLCQANNLPHVLDEIADCLEHLGSQYSVEYEKLYRNAFYVADFFNIRIKEKTKVIYEAKFGEYAWYEVD